MQIYMIDSTGIKQDKKPGYRPTLCGFCFFPGLEPGFYYPFLRSGVDAIIIGTAVPTGGLNNEGDFSFIPFISEATSKRIPVYIVRGSYSAAERQDEYVYRRRMDSIYAPERDAIRAGAIPLERPDASQLQEVINAIWGVYSRKPGYEDGIQEVGALFSSPEFMKQIRLIQDPYINQRSNRL